ncbi:MAG: PEGA domain-containing protein [Methanomicrobiales archaeon]|nr:PEGA domain-containing protein [Methanomicrobiales archaeon]
MIKQNLKLTVAAIILLCVCIGAASGATVTAQGGSIGSPGSTGEFAIIVDSLPSGLTGFTITVALGDPAKAEIIGVTFPSWAGDGLIIAGNGPLPADSVWITVVDLHENVQAGATNVELASLDIRGDATGTTGLLLTEIQIDDEGGYPVPYTIVNGTITIGSTPPPVVNGTVQVQSTPTGADVILDGAGKGTTPLTIADVGAGVHTLRLEKTGYYPYQDSITVNAGQGRVLPVPGQHYCECRPDHERYLDPDGNPPTGGQRQHQRAVNAGGSFGDP